MTETKTVLKEYKFPKSPGMDPFSIILVKKGAEYITWVRNDATGGYGSGNYFMQTIESGVSARQMAERDYHLRVAHNLEYPWAGLFAEEVVE